MDVFFFLPSLLVVGALIAIFSGRSEPDPEQERPQAIYLSIVSIVTLAVVLGATFAVLNGLAGLTDKHSNQWIGYSPDEFIGESPFTGPERFQVLDDLPHSKANHDDDVRMIVQGLIVLAVAGGVRKFHHGALREAASKSTGPGKRVYQRYIYAACFTTCSIAVGTGAYALTRIPGLMNPDTFGVLDRGEALRGLGVFGVFTLILIASFRSHWFRRGNASPFAPPPAPTPVNPPPAPPAAKAAPAKKAAAKKAAPRTK